MRQLSKRDHARPIAVGRSSVVRQRTIALAADRDLAGDVPANVTFHVGIDKVLRRAAVIL